MNMQNIALIFPSESEIGPFLSRVETEKEERICGLKLLHARFKNLNLAMIICGIGKVNAAMATQAVIDREKPHAVILCGVSGGIRKGLHIGDTVLCAKVAHHDVDPAIVSEDNGYGDAWFESDETLLSCFEKAVNRDDLTYRIVTGKLVTGEQFIDQEGRAKIVASFDPDCVDMETAAVAQVCSANHIPFFAIRSITDTEEESGVHTFRENLAVASDRACSVLSDGLDAMAYQTLFAEKE